MESSRPAWIRPLVVMLVAVLIVGCVLGAARGREAVPSPAPTPIEPTPEATVEPAPEAAPEPTPAPSPTARPRPRPEAEPSPKPKPKHKAEREPKRKAEREPKRKAERKAKPKPEPKPRPTPSPRATASRHCQPVSPKLTLGVISRLRDDRIDESSGLAMSARHRDLAYTMNDEGTSPLIFAIQPSTGRTLGAFDLRDAGGFKDPESIRADAHGRIWLADTGDGHPGKPGKKHGRPKRHRVAIAVFDEPNHPHGGAARARRHAISYSNGPHNVEALLIHPVTNQAFLISSDKAGRVYELPNPLKGGHNVAQATSHRMPGFVTDATFTPDGHLVLVRTMNEADVLVFDAATWRKVGSIRAPRMPKGESIAVEAGGRSVILGSEGRHSPLVRVALSGFGEPAVSAESGC